MLTIKERVLQLAKKEPNKYTRKEASKVLNASYKTVREVIREYNLGDFFLEHTPPRGIIEKDAHSQEKEMQPTQKQLDALLDECKEHGIDVNDVKYYWHKSNRISMFVVAQNRPTYETVRDALIQEMKKHSPKYPSLSYKKPKDGHMLVLDPADIHIGKLAVKTETGYQYDMETAVRMVHEGCEGILTNASGFPIEKILLIVGNDVLHRDNPHNTTTSGTRQDTDGMWHEAFIAARQMYVQLIERLMQVAPVHVVYNPSNHDYQSGYMLTDALYCWFHTSKNVTFDAEIIHRKYFQYGQNLIATSHGDGAKMADMPLLIAAEQPQMWANTSHRYVYLHHLHHKIKHQFLTGKDFPAINIEYLRSPSASDSWHHRNGYTGAPQAIEGFIHHPTKGRVASLCYVF